jgi:hypothetical protein
LTAWGRAAWVRLAVALTGETADVLRLRSAAAYARHNGTAPLPVWFRSPPRTGRGRHDDRAHAARGRAVPSTTTALLARIE